MRPLLVLCLIGLSQKQLGAIADEASKIADQLLGLLSHASAEGGSGVWDKISASFSAIWNSGTIKAKEERLKEMRANLQFEVVLELREKAEEDGTLNDTTLRSIGEHTRKAIEDALERFQSPVESGALTAESVFEQITRRLNFREREQRGDDIDPKHAKTFEWIYESPDNQTVPWASLVDWLKTPGGVYWISGRAGSGKSTLMKFLNEVERGRQGNADSQDSSRPAGEEQQPLILSFYFWNAGNQLAKSQEGLFRSLLWQALQLDPSLGPILFPAQYRPGASWPSFPTFGQLRHAFGNLTKQTSRKILFLIDGLDEFEATRISVSDLADLFAVAAKSPGIKAILSSRPLHGVEDSLGTAQLHLHDLTRTDIMDYVNCILMENPRMAKLFEESPKDAAALVDNVVDSANGVFLWVTLVSRSLVEGLRNHDSIDDLRGRLAELPPDLEKLFERMLGQIDPRYRISSSKIFQLVKAGKDADSAFPTACTLYFADLSHEEVLAAGVQPITLQEQEARVRKTEIRLKVHTAGLIEVQPAHANAPMGRRVDYIHRTAADFVGKNWKKLVGGTSQVSGFPDAAQSLLDCILMQIKTHPLEAVDSGDSFTKKPNFGSLWELVFGAMEIAKHFHYAAEDTFDELERSMEHQFKRIPDDLKGQVNWTCKLPTVRKQDGSERPWHECNDNFFCLAVQHNLIDYVLAKTTRHGEKVVRKRGRPVLDCLSFLATNYLPGKFEPAIVEALLRNSADPNEKFYTRSPWERILDIQESSDFPIPDDFKDRLPVYKLFIQYGADPNAKTTRHGLFWTLQFSALYVFLDMFHKRNDPRYKTLETEITRMLKRKGAKAKQWRDVVVEDFEDNTTRSVWRRRYPPREGACVSYLDKADFAPSWKKKLTRRIRSREEDEWIMGSKGSPSPTGPVPRLSFSR